MNQRRRTLPFAGCLAALSAAVMGLLPNTAHAQQPEPPFGPQPPFGAQPAPGAAQPGAPQPGAAQPGAPPPAGAQPAPGSFGGPAAQPAPGSFGAQPAPSAGFGASAQVGGSGASFGGGASATSGSTSNEFTEREQSLLHQNGLSGSTGLLRTAYAGSGAQGTFRVGFMFDWFSSSGFLCDPGSFTEADVPITCSGANGEDSTSHVGGTFNLSATPLSFLEGYASIRTYANNTTYSNGSGGDTSQLLQVLGDTTLGVKAFTPPRFLGPLSFGGELQMMLLNGSGDVGLTGGATSAAIRALSSLDLRKPGGKGFPLLAHLNLGYKIDNSGAAVEDVEIARAAAFDDGRTRQPISRIERFGLGINKVDSFQTYLGAEVPLWFVQPFLEYTIDIPVNRQGYECSTRSVSRGDVCLGLTDLSDPNGSGAGFSAVPSRLTLGARVSPFKEAFRGLSGLVAFDIGLTGTSTFIEEVAPQAPWTLFLGLGYAYDTKEKVVEAAPPPPPPPVVLPAPQSFARGFVHEQGKAEGIANAIVSFQGAVQPPVATGADGRFLSRHLEPGQYTFEISATGYKPGTCTATVAAAAPAQPQSPQFGTGAFGLPMAQPGQPAGGQSGQFGAGQPGQYNAPPPAPGPTYVDVDCALEALPRSGNIVGSVRDAAGGTPVSGAVVTVVDSLGREQKVTADGTGSFRVEGLPPGETSMRVEAGGFMNHVSEAEVRTSEDVRASLSLNKRPKNAQVKIQGNEIKLSDKILFETDSAKILGQSSALLEEIAEVMGKNPNLALVEIQGHTDNTGSRERNQRLSDERANAVRTWLVKAGVAGSRLQAKGYGQDRPVAPNVTEGNRSKNRRVQFIIVKK